MVYIENTGLRDCSGFLQTGSHIVYVAMWPLVTYSYYFESFYCDLSSLANWAQLRYVSLFNTVILYHYTLYTIL